MKLDGWNLEHIKENPNLYLRFKDETAASREEPDACRVGAGGLSCSGASRERLEGEVETAAA